MNTLTYAVKKEWYNLVLLLVPFLAIPFLWDLLPAQVPIHWNLQGEVDDYGSKAMGLFLLPSVNAGLYLLNLYLPKIDPKRRITIGQKPIPVIRTLLVCFLFAMHGWMISVALGYSISSGWIFPAIALFFVVIGNYLRTVQPNYFIGIRVPWALEDEENWRRTHRLGSVLWVAGGLLLLILFPLLDQQTYSIAFVIITAVMVLIPAGFSFYLYKSSTADQ